MPAGHRVLATLSWGGPDRGVVFLLSCDGRLLSADDPGYMRGLEIRDVDGDGIPDLVLRHETGTGTGWRQEYTTIYRLLGDSLAVAWSGITFEGSYQGPALGGQWELRAAVSFPTGGEIRVTQDSGAVQYDRSKKEFVYDGRPTRAVRRFGWSPALGLFQQIP